MSYREGSDHIVPLVISQLEDLPRGLNFSGIMLQTEGLSSQFRGMMDNVINVAGTTRVNNVVVQIGGVSVWSSWPLC